jgi:hypothetical protein
MAKVTKTTVRSQVYKVLQAKVELGGVTELNKIVDISNSDIDTFCNEFRTDYAHLIPYSYKDSSVNRYVELFLKTYKAV